jgi:hypothetical protein
MRGSGKLAGSCIMRAEELKANRIRRQLVGACGDGSDVKVVLTLSS